MEAFLLLLEDNFCGCFVLFCLENVGFINLWPLNFLLQLYISAPAVVYRMLDQTANSKVVNGSCI